MIAHTFRIPYVNGQTIELRPISDVHLGSVNCDLKEFKKFVTDNPEAYFIGLGDLLDSVIVSDVKRYRKSNDASPSDAIIDDQIKGMLDILTPLKDRILGLGCGNHEDSITKHCGTDPTKRMCEALGVPYLGYSWLAQLIMRQESGGGRTVVIRGHHGWGGGSRTQGADLTKYSRDTAYWDADLFLYGHVHKKQADRVPRLSLVGSEVIAKPKHFIICGTFLKTLGDSTDPTYSEIKGYPPTEIGGVAIRMKPNSNRWVDIRVSL